VSSSQSTAQPESGTPRRWPDPLRSLVGARLRFRPSADATRIVVLWVAWLAVICAFQIVVDARFQPARPDNVLAWTSGSTGDGFLVASGPNCRPLLADPNMNEHVAYDSEYYISIAMGGYDDPNAQAYVSQNGHTTVVGVPTCTAGMDGWTPLNYAFMPAYPMLMRPVMAVEGVLPFTNALTDTGRATLAGIVVSALGGLLAMLALARLMAFLERRRRKLPAGEGSTDTATAEPTATSTWGGSHGLRAALYLLVFPTGFYLAQVYTEGLFLGLAFMACALAVEKKLVWAAAFAVVAAVTRQAGFLLFLPIAWAAFQVLRDGQTRPKGWRIGVPIVAAIAPVAAFAAWFVSPLGQNWQVVEREFFGRSFDLAGSIDMWHKSWDSLVTGVDKTGVGGGYAIFGGGPLPSSTSVYITLEFLALVLGIAACVWLLRKMPGVALFGLAVIVLSAGSSSAQGMDRYVLAVPAIFLMLASFGRRDLFDRVWVMTSTLLMGMLVTLYTFGFWVS
jgi:hypothetical protein